MLFCHAICTFLYKAEKITSRVTFAVEQIDDQTYNYAAAWTAPCDQFAKKTGRQIASARLLNGSPNHVHSVTTGAEDYQSVFETVMGDAMSKAPCRWSMLDIRFSHTVPSVVTA